MARYFTRLRLVKYLAISHADSCNKSYIPVTHLEVCNRTPIFLQCIRQPALCKGIVTMQACTMYCSGFIHIRGRLPPWTSPSQHRKQATTYYISCTCPAKQQSDDGWGLSCQLKGHAAHASVHNSNLHLPMSTPLTRMPLTTH